MMKNLRYSVKVSWFAAIAGAAFFIILGAPPLDWFLFDENDAQFLLGGEQVLRGKFPGADILMPSGFLPLYTSAIAQHIFGGPVGVLWIGVLGYLISTVILCWLLLKQDVPVSVCILIGILTIVFIPYHRFFRWQQWLMPILSVYLIHWLYSSSRPGFWTGSLLGGFLCLSVFYRVDIGLACAIGAMPAIIIRCVCLQSQLMRYKFIDGNLFGVAFAFLGWLSLVKLGEGSYIVNLNLALEALTYHAKKDWTAGPPENYLAICLLLSCYLFLILDGIRILSKRAIAEKIQLRVIELTTGLIGIGGLPSIIYYPNVFHIQFGMPLGLLAIGLILGKLKTKRVKALFLLVPLFIAWIIIPWTLRFFKTYEAYYGKDLGYKLNTYADIDGILTRNPLGRLVIKARVVTPENEEIFMFSNSMGDNVLYFVQRPVAIFFNYHPDLFYSEILAEINFNKINFSPPHTVIVNKSVILHSKMAHWNNFLKFKYQCVVYDSDDYQIRIRDTDCLRRD